MIRESNRGGVSGKRGSDFRMKKIMNRAGKIIKSERQRNFYISTNKFFFFFFILQLKLGNILFKSMGK